MQVGVDLKKFQHTHIHTRIHKLSEVILMTMIVAVMLSTNVTKLYTNVTKYQVLGFKYLYLVFVNHTLVKLGILSITLAYKELLILFTLF